MDEGLGDVACTFVVTGGKWLSGDRSTVMAGRLPFGADGNRNSDDPALIYDSRLLPLGMVYVAGSGTTEENAKLFLLWVSNGYRMALLSTLWRDGG